MRKTLIYIIALAAAAFFTSLQADAQTNGKVRTISTAEFKTLVYDISDNTSKYLGKKPAIVDFYADWCGPCRAISPILEELAKEYGDKIVIYKVNIDKSPELAQAFGIRSIPAVMYVPVKGEAKMTLGSRSKEKFQKEIATYLGVK